MNYRSILVLSLLSLALALPIQAQQVIDLTPGDSVASSSSESKEVTEKVKRQIAELSQSILHGEPQFSLVGTLQQVGEQYMINGDVFSINDDTVIFGNLAPGVFAEVRGVLVQGKPKVAKQVTIASDKSGTNLKLNNGGTALDFPAADRR